MEYLLQEPREVSQCFYFEFFKCLPFRVCLANSSEIWLHH